MRRNVVVAALAVVALGVGGCGGSDPLTRAEFVKRAEAVCAQVGRKTERMKVNKLDDFAAKYIALERGKADGIGALEPPDGLRGSVDQYIGVLNDRSAFFKRAMAEIRAHRKLRQQDVAAAELQTRERELANTLHLRVCASSA